MVMALLDLVSVVVDGVHCVVGGASGCGLLVEPLKSKHVLRALLTLVGRLRRKGEGGKWRGGGGGGR